MGSGPLLRCCAVGLIALFTAALASEALATATVNKQFTPATADPGEISRFRISFFNSSLVPLTAAAVTDNLLAQVTIAAVPNIADTCGFGTVVAAGGTSTIRLSGGTIPAGTGIADGTCYFEVDVVSVVPGNWQNTIPANGPANGFTPGGATAGFQATEVASVVTNTTPAVATLSIKSLTNPTGVKTFAPTTALVGEPITLSIVLTNANAGSTIPLTSFTDTLPAGLVVAAVPNPTIACTGTGAVNGVVTANPGDPSVTLTGGTIGMGGSCTVTARVVANTVTGTSQVFTNLIPANAIGNTRGLSSATFNRQVTVNSPITLAKSFVATVGGSAIGATPIVAGQEVYARIDIGNSSTVNPLTITSLTDSLPTGLVVGSTLPVVIDCTTNGGGTNGTVTAVPGSTSFTVANAVVGITGGTRRCRVSVPVVASASGAYLNSIPANAVTNPGNLGSPAASATLNVNSQLTVTKTANPANAAPGQPVTFTITIRNYSTGPVSGVQFTDTLPLVGANQMVISNPNNFSAPSPGCSGGTFSNTSGASSLSWTGGTITGGIGIAPGVCTITFNANTPIGTPIGATFTNAIAAGGITGDGGITNPGGTSANVVMVAAASVSKQFLPASVVQGGTSVLTVVMSNQTATPLTNSSLIDTLPAGVIVSATPGTTTSCASGVVTAAALGNTVSIAGATIPANGNCNFTVNVVGNTVGVRTNTIPALALNNDQNAQNPSSASANLTVTSGLTATKSFTPTSVANGGVSRVTVRVSNPSGTPLTGVAITDGPMLNLVVANPAGASTTCAGSPVIVATPGSNTVTLTGASIAAGGNCDLLFNVLTSNNPTNWPNTLPIGNITSNEGASNTAAVSATLGKVTTISIGINKSFNPVSVSGSQPSVLQIDLTNPVGSPSAVNNLSFTDNLPNGMEVHAVPNISTTCTNGTVTAVPGTATITLSGATLPAASTCSVFVNVTSVRFLNLVNTIPVGAVTTTQGITNSLATTATLSTLQGLGVMKSFTPTSASVGQPVLMDIRVLSTLNPTAQPPVTLHNVSFTDTLPPGMTVANPPNASTTCVNGSVNAVAGASTVTVTGADIDPETNCHVYVNVVADSLGAFTNTIPTGAVSSTEGYQNPNPASATLNVVTSPPLTKSFSPNTVLPGQNSVLTITIANPNALVLTNVALTDTLPPGLVTSTTPNPQTTCTGGAVSAPASGNTIALTNGTIGNNGSCTITVNVLSNTPNGYTNTIPAGALTTAQGVSNVNPASSTLIVLGPPGVSKSFTPTTIGVNMTSLLTLTLSNGNAVAGTLTAPLVDTLPGGLVIANPPNLSGTCTLASVTATANSGSITYASGAALPATGCTIVVDVTSPTPGTYVNTIPAGGLVTDAGTNAAPATATLIVNAPPTLAKTMLPASIAIGGSSTLTLTFGNSNADAITLTAAFNDPMPAGVTTTGVVTNTCGAVVTAGAVTVPSGTSIPAGGCTIVVTITSSTPGPVVNLTDPLSTTTGTAPAAQAPLTVTALAPTLAKSIAPAAIAAGDPATLTLTLGNPNAVPILLSAQFTDPMPAGVTITGPNSGTCGGVTVTANSVAVAAGTAIPVGACTIIVAITSSTPGTVTNTTGTLTTNAGDAPPASADLTVSAPPTLAKSIAPASIGIGGASTLTLTLGNSNPTPITLTSAFGDTMPAGVTTTGVVTNTCGAVVTSGAITVASGTVIAAGGCVIVVTITSSTPGTVTNITDPLVTSTGTAPSAQAPLLVTVISSALTKTILPSTITAGGASTLTIALANSNVAPLFLTAAFTDTMPAGVTTTGNSTGSCPGVTVTATSITMASGSAIAPGGCTIIVPITSFTPGTVTNTTGTLQTTGGTSTPASAPLAVTASIPTLTKTIVPGTIAVGGSATLTITLGNINTTPLLLTTIFVDPMPSGVTTTSAHTGTCPGVSVNSAFITMASGSAIPPGGCTIVVTITSSTPGTVTNTTSSLQTSAGATPPASAPLTVGSGTGPTLVKTIAPATIAAGGTATLTITLGNPGLVPLTLTSAFTDTMPAGVTTTSGNTGTCAGVTVTPTTITMASGSTLPVGGCSIVVTITSSTPGTVTNTTGSLSTSGGTAPPASAPITVGSGSGPTLAKAIAPATIAVGGTATLTITLGNPGAVPLTLSAAFTDTMPAGVTTTSGNTGTCSGVSVTSTTITMANGGTIPPGGCTIVVTITSSTPGTVTNTTGPLSTGGGSAPPASAPITVGSGPTLAKTIAPATIAAGGTATLTITLGNPGAAPLTLTAAFADTMPAGVTTTSGNSGTCSGVTVTSTTISMANGTTIPPGGCTIVVTITSSTAGTVTNTTGPLSTTGGGAPPASAPITVTGGAVSLAKSIAPAVIAQDGKATLTITLGNATGAPVVLTAPFTDPMPAGLTATGANTGTCTGVTVTPALITMATGSSIPAGGCTIVVSVTSSSLGVVTNVTSALQTTGGNAPPATAPVNVVTPLDPSVPIPVDSPVALLLLAAFLALFGAGRLKLQRRR